MTTARRWMIGIGLVSATLGLLGTPSCGGGYREETAPDASPLPDATPTEEGDGEVPDAGTPPVDAAAVNGDADADADADATTCDVSKVATDPKNCGACGRDCLVGTCTAGKCDGAALGTVPNAKLFAVVEHGGFVYASARAEVTTDISGIWRVAKTPGSAPVRYVDVRYAEEMRVLGDTLYFVVDDEAGDAGTMGGLWSCDLRGPTPCTPKLLRAGNFARGVRVVDGVVYSSDKTHGISRFDPSIPNAVPTTWRSDFAPSHAFFAGARFFYLGIASAGSNLQELRLWDALVESDVANVVLVSKYTTHEPRYGELLGTKDALYFSGYDDVMTSGGVVRRVPQPPSGTATLCDYGGASNLRPRGLLLDGNRIYWTNLGAPGDTDVRSSVAYCDLGGCCATPTFAWSGTSRASAITSDATSLYWSALDGSIWRLAKPSP